MSAKRYGVGFEADIAPTLAAGQHDASVVYSIDRAAFNQGENAKYDFEISDSGINSTLVSKGPSAVAHETNIYNSSGDGIVKHNISWIVRRLTPLECERLQGFPDGWTDIDNSLGDGFDFELPTYDFLEGAVEAKTDALYDMLVEAYQQQFIAEKAFNELVAEKDKAFGVYNKQQRKENTSPPSFTSATAQRPCTALYLTLGRTCRSTS